MSTSLPRKDIDCDVCAPEMHSAGCITDHHRRCNEHRRGKPTITVSLQDLKDALDGWGSSDPDNDSESAFRRLSALAWPPHTSPGRK